MSPFEGLVSKNRRRRADHLDAADLAATSRREICPTRLEEANAPIKNFGQVVGVGNAPVRRADLVQVATYRRSKAREPAGTAVSEIVIKKAF